LRAGILLVVVRIFLFLGGAGTVDQGVNGSGVLAALLAQHMCCLAGESAETDITVNSFRQVPCKGGLSGAGKAEQSEHLTVAALQPGGGILQGSILLGGPGHGEAPSRFVPLLTPF